EAQGGGLAGAVGAREAIGLPAPDAHAEIAHAHLAREGLGQVFDLDRDRGVAVSRAGPVITVAHGSGLGRAPAARRPAGRPAGARAVRVTPRCETAGGRAPRG